MRTEIVSRTLPRFQREMLALSVQAFLLVYKQTALGAGGTLFLVMVQRAVLDYTAKGVWISGLGCL